MSRFSRVLVANRGEIAVRVIATARALGYETVAVFSDPDRDALHVREADEAVRLGPGPVGESYLSVDRVLAAAKATGAGAIHPGYGFLSENAAFAERCAEAGIVFVGPPPAAIRLMGDKVQAKRRMVDAGVPTAPAYLGSDPSDATLRQEAERLGFPLLVKAVAGGGGRGMRRVDGPAGLAEAIQTARSEAASAFGNGELFVETLVEGARHVEVQVFADEHGNAVHLHERECSVQRRHQKIIEEAPSPAVDADLRAKMGEAAVAAARAIDYVGAGTVEFLLDDDGAFYFLEMNTRLQVEHPVTEQVTGEDLVAWQLAVAQGEPLPREQGDIGLHGHAIEARLYAEDPAAGFLPQVGTVHRFVAPAPGGPQARGGMRVDTGVASGQEISSFYDPMIAKVIGFGPDRPAAIRQLRRALWRTSALGLVTNRDFLLDVLQSEAFAGGTFKTDTIDREWTGDRLARTVPDEHFAVGAALVARGATTDGWRSTGTSMWPVTLRVGEQTRELEVDCTRGRFVVRTPGEDAGVSMAITGRDDALTVEIAGVQRPARVAVVGRDLWLDYRGCNVAFEEPSAASEHDAGPSDGQVRAPIGGRVIALDVEPGATVEPGQLLLRVEAMKIEHRVTAPRAGTVDGLAVAPGDQVVSGQILCSIAEDPA